MRRRMPPSSSAKVTTRPRTFSKIRGAAAMKVGETTARLSMIRSTRPSTAAAEPVATLGGEQHLPEGVRQGQPEVLQVVGESSPSPSTALPS
jgi:hypothetical protein